MEIKFDQEFDICMLELNSLSALKNIFFLASSASKLGEVTVHFANNLSSAYLERKSNNKRFYFTLPTLSYMWPKLD